jgi:hypothetical protein
VSGGFQFVVGIEDTFVPHAFPWYRLNPAPGGFLWDLSRPLSATPGDRGPSPRRSSCSGPGEALPVAARPRRDDWTTGLEELLRAFAGRYGRPLMVTETSVLMSLYDLEADEIGTLHRRAAPVADRFRAWTASNRFKQHP